MKGKILRETFDKNLNEVIRLKQAEDFRDSFAGIYIWNKANNFNKWNLVGEYYISFNH